MTTLRPYQKTAIEQTRKALKKHRSTVLQMPTGAGKTRVATEIVATTRGVIWFVCHRREIIRQAAKAFAAAGIDFGVVSPEYDFEPNKRVQIASVQTLVNRIDALDAPNTVIWDECHHAVSKSWNKIREATQDAKHIGLTATPERLDGQGLTDVFGSIVIGPSIRKLIHAKHLSQFRYFAPSEPDLSKARIHGRDYAKGDIGKIMNSAVLIGDAVSEYKKNLRGKRALVFAASIAASQAIVRKFRKEKIAAVHIDGTTPTAERDAAVADLAAGRIKVLSNVEVFTEGFDLPAIDAVILMRPTKSLALLLQMVGRALRPAPGKKEALIFDHAGLWLDHGMPDAEFQWSLEGKARAARIAAIRAEGGRLRRCPKCKEVRAERVERCDCGFKFKTGREIGEFDGQLYELQSDVPEGCVTVAEFAKRHGVFSSTPLNWGKRGMPMQGYHIPLKAGDAWVKENVTARPAEGCVTRQEYAKMKSTTFTAVNYWIKKLGMPTEGAHIRCAVADTWLSENPPQQLFFKKGFVTKAEFARITGLSESLVYGLVRDKKIPADGNWIKLKPAKAFIEREWNPVKVTQIPDQWKKGLIPPSYFTAKYGFPPSLMSKLTRDGLPGYHSNRMFKSAEVVSWLRKRNSKRLPPVWLPDWADRECPAHFCVRLGIPRHAIECYSSLRGLPCASNGWVHIQKGLEWVRDNTNIKIPASAWPKPRKIAA